MTEPAINGQLCGLGTGKKGNKTNAHNAAVPVTNTVVKYLFGADLTTAFQVHGVMPQIK